MNEDVIMLRDLIPRYWLVAIRVVDIKQSLLPRFYLLPVRACTSLEARERVEKLFPGVRVARVERASVGRAEVLVRCETNARVRSMFNFPRPRRHWLFWTKWERAVN
jgi:hypothetical protein